MLVSRGRLALSLDVERWLALLASHPAVRFLALDAAGFGGGGVQAGCSAGVIGRSVSIPLLSLIWE